MQKQQITRFALVGVANTGIDAALFVLLSATGLSIFLANLCSTSVALVFSLIVNKNFTFKGARLTPKRIVFYFAVTLFGLWALQPLVIKLIIDLNSYVPYLTPLVAIAGHRDVLKTLIPKLGATAVTLVWNYLWYSRVIFKSADNKD